MVDPNVICDPLEGGGEQQRSPAMLCMEQRSLGFRSVLRNSFECVERSATPPATPGGKANNTPSPTDDRHGAEGSSAAAYHAEAGFDLMDPSSPLLSCLLSFYIDPTL